MSVMTGSLPPWMTEKVPTSLVGAANEHCVLAQPLLRGFLAALTPRCAPLADIVVHSSDWTPVAQIQVKARSGRHGHGWRLSKKNEDTALTHGRLFCALIDFGQPASDFPVYVVPSATVADYLRSAHQAWLATPGKGGKEHHDWAGRFVSPALPFEGPALSRRLAGRVPRPVGPARHLLRRGR